MATADFILLGRPECHLCEDFEAELRAHWPADGALQLRVADVDDRGEWRMRYGARIPVLLDADGEVALEGRFDLQRWQAVCARVQNRGG
ncbi:glutaredoxin family protein [Sinimarinibacterium sp. NLF-5-8]|uniref:glutaredoxin family protein n=1 Tax=Sinimarinibacterium sp. NLF-5-8 TaxID=2698684 RepID=UPI00137C1798|nr:glutaredoxin family protein [Sinimarinibacterium sp. NLF-5-8]QHS09831.1 glutaredoxin family protein [Sinimarinibacterium sp. NLF-5-8]